MPIDSSKISVSIIIPVYQGKDTLERCVCSCLSQKNIAAEEIELIIVDDGSTDESGSIADKLALEDEGGRIKVIHTDNHGVSHARNTGIESATGRFVAFVDSDDYLTEDHLSKLIKYADEETRIVDETDSYAAAMKINGFNYIENAILNQDTHVWGKLFDRKLIVDGNIRFEEGLTIGEDLLFLMDVATFIGKKRVIRCIAESSYVYTENENSAMNRAFKPSYLDQLICWKKAEERLFSIREYVSPYAFVSVGVSQILTALLVVGKVAVQGDDRDKKLDETAISKVKEQIDHALKTRGVFAALSFGHKLKVIVFRCNPDWYLRLYSRHKSA